MKMIKTILILAASLFAASVKAQPVDVIANSVVTPFVILTNLSGTAFSNVPASTISIDCSSQQNMAVEWTFWSSHATSVSNVALRFIGLPISGTRPSDPTLADGFYMTRNSGGSTNLVVVTNFNVKGYSRLDLLYMTNNSSEGYISNSLRTVIKKNAP